MPPEEVFARIDAVTLDDVRRTATLVFGGQHALAACKATAAAWERDNSGDPSSASDPGHPP